MASARIEPTVFATATSTPLPTSETAVAPSSKLSDPIMLTYQESYTGAANWFATAGGKPLANWSGLDTTSPRQAPNSKQDHPAKSDAKMNPYAKRIFGLTQCLSRKVTVFVTSVRMFLIISAKRFGNHLLSSRCCQQEDYAQHHHRTSKVYYQPSGVHQDSQGHLSFL